MKFIFSSQHEYAIIMRYIKCNNLYREQHRFLKLEISLRNKRCERVENKIHKNSHCYYIYIVKCNVSICIRFLQNF